ncbi:Beta-lactamase domain protein [Ketogulonicigenium robustum]|uniref:UPF0173 metal-dependent hydrolase BVG79_02098 n=1 Tax=Ketogulonicigenium robustum TaxID=92947 RepID=A0A1W6P1P9_9RHOB|nr:metal-dependent hydrolase [Ketogulonicigenium robustum]ARO15438.1 Beta-lactamase domain protein [Ketogulonicigenium robustum]
MNIIWLGHGSFRIEAGDQVLLVDPWLTGNPAFPEKRREEAIKGATHILLTHAHSDHIADALEVSTVTGAPIAAIADLAGYLHQSAAAEVIGFNKGGTLQLGDVAVTMVNACHSSSLSGPDGLVAVGSEAGFMIAAEGHVIYFTGDTDIMADMAWMGEYHAPDIGILSAGGHYTMDMKRAAWAAKKYFAFKTVIPCHYRTFLALEQNADVLKAGLPGVNVIEPEVLVPIAIAAK